MISSIKFIRLAKVNKLTCLSKSSIYRLMGEGEFPKQVALGARSVVWVKPQIDNWCESKLNGT